MCRITTWWEAGEHGGEWEGSRLPLLHCCGIGPSWAFSLSMVSTHTPGLRPRTVSRGLAVEHSDCLSGLSKVNPGVLALTTHVCFYWATKPPSSTIGDHQDFWTALPPPLFSTIWQLLSLILLWTPPWRAHLAGVFPVSQQATRTGSFQPFFLSSRQPRANLCKLHCFQTGRKPSRGLRVWLPSRLLKNQLRPLSHIYSPRATSSQWEAQGRREPSCLRWSQAYAFCEA